jgi:hypothetical protein
VTRREPPSSWPTISAAVAVEAEPRRLVVVSSMHDSKKQTLDNHLISGIRRVLDPMETPGALDMSEALLTDTRLDGRYVVEEGLGRGAFAFTYRARDEKRGVTVAIKELFPENCQRLGLHVLPRNSAGADLLSRSVKWFSDEAQILRGFRDPRIVEVRETFSQNGTIYVVLEYLAGNNLEEEARAAGGTLPPSHVQRLLKEILLGLEVVHSGKFLHRDLKPSNVMSTRDGRTVLIDFGAAREHRKVATHTASTMMFTWDYAAPEQLIPGSSKTAATDLYAVGGIGFRLLMGVPIKRWEGEVARGDLERLGAPTLIDTIGWALQEEPRDRPRSAAEMRAALENLRRPGRGAFDTPRRRVPRPGPSPPKRSDQFGRASRRARAQKPKVMTSEARWLARHAPWPLALLVAAPGLVLPLLTGALYAALVLAGAVILGLGKAMRDAAGSRRVTAATLLFLLPRFFARVAGGSFVGLIYALAALMVLALTVAVGAALAAGYSVAQVIVLGQALTHASFVEGLNEALPRTAVTAPIVLLLAPRMSKEGGVVRRAALRAASITEASVAVLWLVGMGLPLLVILYFACNTWAPFKNYTQACRWAEARVAFVAHTGDATARARAQEEIRRSVPCSKAAGRYWFNSH